MKSLPLGAFILHSGTEVFQILMLSATSCPLRLKSLVVRFLPTGLDRLNLVVLLVESLSGVLRGQDLFNKSLLPFLVRQTSTVVLGRSFDDSPNL